MPDLDIHIGSGKTDENLGTKPDRYMRKWGEKLKEKCHIYESIKDQSLWVNIYTFRAELFFFITDSCKRIFRMHLPGGNFMENLITGKTLQTTLC